MMVNILQILVYILNINSFGDLALTLNKKQLQSTRFIRLWRKSNYEKFNHIITVILKERSEVCQPQAGNPSN